MHLDIIKHHHHSYIHTTYSSAYNSLPILHPVAGIAPRDYKSVTMSTSICSIDSRRYLGKVTQVACCLTDKQYASPQKRYVLSHHILCKKRSLCSVSV